MRKRKMYVATAILLVIMIMASLTGCSSQTQSQLPTATPASTASSETTTRPVSTTSPETTASPATTVSPEPDRETEIVDAASILSLKQTGTGSVVTDADGPFGRYATPITMNWIRFTDQNSESTIAKLKAITGETWDENRWIKLYREEMGINVKYDWIGNGDQGNQKFKLAMASGNLPDYFPLSSLVDLSQLAEGGMIQDLTPYWDKYASPITKAICTADGTAALTACTVNGKLMAIPEVSAALDSYSYLFIRTDWLKKLNLEAPKTFDDLLKISSAFTQNDPDGNGKKDTFGMVLDKSLWYRLNGFFWSTSAYPNTWVKDAAGNLAYGSTQPEMLLPLKTLSNMYKDGQIDQEFGVKDDTKATEIVASGKAGILYGGHWEPVVSILKNHQNDPNADWNCYTLPGIDGTPATGRLQLGMGTMLCAKTGAKNPEALVKMLNLYYEMLYGTTGDYENWGNDEVDGIWWIGPCASFHPLVNVVPYRDIQKVVAGEIKLEDLKGVSKEYAGNVFHSDPNVSWPWAKMFNGADCSFAVIDKVLNQKLLFNNYFVGAPTATMIDKMTTLEELQNTTFTKIILGTVDAESGFNKFVEDWKKLGGDQITKEVNAWYAVNGAK